MRIWRGLFLILFALGLVSCCACRRGQKVIDKPLMATQWTLVELHGQQIRAEDNYYIILDEREGQFNGRGDCNSLIGSYELGEKGMIKLVGLARTNALCPDQAGEDKFFGTLGDVTNYDVDGNLLLLFNADSELIAVMAAK